MTPPRADFVDRFRVRFGQDVGPHTAAGHACAQIVLEALREVARRGVAADGLREAVRAAAVDEGRQYDTVIGPIGFDRNGDSRQQLVTIYRAEPGSGDGGEWVIERQENLASVP